MSVDLGVFQELVGFNFGTKNYADGNVYLCTVKQGVTVWDVLPDLIVRGVSSETGLLYNNGNGGLSFDAVRTAQQFTYTTYYGYFLGTGQNAILRDADWFSGCADYPDAVTYNPNFIPGTFHHDQAYNRGWTIFNDGSSRFTLLRRYYYTSPGNYAFVFTGAVIKKVQTSPQLVCFVNGGGGFIQGINLIFFTTDKVATLPVGTYFVVEFDDGRKINLKYGSIRHRLLDAGYSKAIICNLTGYNDVSMYFNQFTDGEHARLTVRQGTPSVPYNTLY